MSDVFKDPNASLEDLDTAAAAMVEVKRIARENERQAFIDRAAIQMAGSALAYASRQNLCPYDVAAMVRLAFDAADDLWEERERRRGPEA